MGLLLSLAPSGDGCPSLLPLKHRREGLLWEFYLCLFDLAQPGLPLNGADAHNHPQMTPHLASDHWQHPSKT